MQGPVTSTRIGQPVPRKEDMRLITGRGRYTDDLSVEGQAYAVMVRSPHAHAIIRAIDVRGALAVPGVVAVLTGADFIADQMKPIPNKTFSLHPAERPLVNSEGPRPFNVPDYPMPADKTRFVGEAIAMVIAESINAAKDGADRVQVDYEPLPSVTFTVDAAAAEAPRVRAEHSSNICIDAQVGDAEATGEGFRKRAPVVQ